MSYTTITPLKQYVHSQLGPYTIRVPYRAGCAGCNGSVWSSKYYLPVHLPAPTGVVRERTEPTESTGRSFSSDGSWREIVRSGAIKMTPGRAWHSRVSFPFGTFHHKRHYYREFGSARSCCEIPVIFEPDHYTVDVTTEWTEQGDFSHWSRQYQGLPRYSSVDDAFDSKVERAKASAWADLVRQYDLGEELAELHQTLQFGESILRNAATPLQTLKRILKSKPRDFMRYWMEYRYALMPLMYSAQDVYKIVKTRDNLYKTVKRTIDADFRPPDIPDGSCFYTVVHGRKTARVTAKGRWTSSRLKVLGQIGMNPITTAWEVIPLSFVADWFVNFGDYLTATTSSWSSMASQLAGCVAVRTATETTTYLQLNVDPIENFSEIILGVKAYDVNRGSDTYETQAVLVQEDDSYDRVLFNETDLSVVLSPFLNWKRLIDGTILSIGNLTRVLRRLS